MDSTSVAKERVNASFLETMVSRRDGDKASPPTPTTWKLIEISVAETFGTACLLFFGCMGLLGENLHTWQGGVVFGLVVATIIQIVGHISDAHLNPSVTVCALVLGRIAPFTAVVYFISECVGAIIGYGLVKVVTPCDLWQVSPANGTYNCNTIPLPTLSDSQALALEFFATMFLIMVVCSVWDERNATKADSLPLKFAATVAVISIVVGPLTGASMNPARSLGPALWNGVWDKHWIYWVAPLSSGFLSSVFYQLMFTKKQHLQPEVAEEVPLTGITEDKKCTRQQSTTTNESKQSDKT